MNDFCTWEINGLKFKLDMEDADTAERYQKALDHIEKIGGTDEVSNTSEQIRKDCELFRSFFIDLLGKEAENIFKDMPDNRNLYFELFYNNFLEFVYKQTICTATRRINVMKQYVPGMRNGVKSESSI